MTRADDAFDLRSEVCLAPEIRPRQAPGEPEGRGAFLTGATGFVGVHVLARLLERGVEPIVCLVRAADPDQALRRIHEALERFGLARPHAAGSIVGLPGDLAAPRFGLPPERFARIGWSVGTIIHCGAWVHLSHPYSVLRDANVGGTQEALRLAATGPSKRLCHLSGMSVFLESTEMVEDAPPPFVPGSRGGYLDTKWVAENLVWSAFERGVPGSIVRLGWISGDSHDGLIAESDAMTLFLQACFRLGSAPRFDDESIPCTPVDIAADAIVRVALDEAGGARAYNLTTTHEIGLEDLYAACRSAGLDVVLQPRDEWLELLRRRLPLLVPVARAVTRDWSMPPLRNELARDVVRRTKHDVSSEELIRAYLPVWRRQRPSAFRPEARERRHG